MRFKEQAFFKLKNKISEVKFVRKTFGLIPLSTPVDSRWTIPLKKETVNRIVLHSVFVGAGNYSRANHPIPAYGAWRGVFSSGTSVLGQ
jgi:hypothetical protein